MPPRVRSERTSLSNCAKAASTPSISLPVDVSSIGSVAERQRYPERLQVRTQGKVIVLLPCEPRQVEKKRRKGRCPCFCGRTAAVSSSVRSAVFALSPSSRNRASTCPSQRAPHRTSVVVGFALRTSAIGRRPVSVARMRALCRHRVARMVRAIVITCDDVNQLVDSKLGCPIVALERRPNGVRRRRVRKAEAVPRALQ